MEKWIGFFGGSFNPPHLGHLLASIYAIKTFELDEIWLAPVFKHRFEKDLAPYDDRIRMCELLVEGFEKYLKVSPIEKNRKSNGKTLETLLAMRKKHPHHHFSLIIGSDLKKETKQWYRFKEIENRFGVLVVPRGCGKGGELGIPDISSTEIRKRLKGNKWLGELVTPAVAAYIFEKGLYRQSTLPRSPRRRDK
ncbi:MAG: nicotinate (nicotinamide) nucleotide adenylyltransferase [Pseudomonadota bacterium]